jgi:hypothetical protein
MACCREGYTLDRADILEMKSLRGRVCNHLDRGTEPQPKRSASALDWRRRRNRHPFLERDMACCREGCTLDRADILERRVASWRAKPRVHTRIGANHGSLLAGPAEQLPQRRMHAADTAGVIPAPEA